jgi:hypothetical protein
MQTNVLVFVGCIIPPPPPSTSGAMALAEHSLRRNIIPSRIIRDPYLVTALNPTFSHSTPSHDGPHEATDNALVSSIDWQRLSSTSSLKIRLAVLHYSPYQLHHPQRLADTSKNKSTTRAAGPSSSGPLALAGN